MKINKNVKRTLCVIGITTYGSGVLFFIFSHWIRVRSNIGEQHHPTERLIRILHTSITYFVILTLGYLLSIHVVPSLQNNSKKQFFSGISILIAILFLTITAIGIFYTSDEGLSNFMIQSHSVVGLLSPLIIFMHVCKKL